MGVRLRGSACQSPPLEECFILAGLACFLLLGQHWHTHCFLALFAAARHQVLLRLLEVPLLRAAAKPQRLGLVDLLFTPNAMDWFVSEDSGCFGKVKGILAIAQI